MVYSLRYISGFHLVNLIIRDVKNLPVQIDRFFVFEFLCKPEPKPVIGKFDTV